MEFRTYAAVLFRRWPLILALAALAAGGAYASSIRTPRVYRATAQLSVTPSIVDFFTGEAVQRLLPNYAQRLRSEAFSEQIAAHLRPTLAPNEVAGKVRAVASPAEYRIAIEVEDADPARARQIANAAAAGFVDKIGQETAGKDRQDIAVVVLEEARLPFVPIRPRPRRDALGAAILGALVGVALAFLLEYGDNTVKTADAAAALLALPVLGAIPGDDRKGVIHGHRPRWPARRSRLHQAALSGSGSVSDATH